MNSHNQSIETLVAERDRTVELIESLSARLAAVLEATSDEASDDEHDPEAVSYTHLTLPTIYSV